MGSRFNCCTSPLPSSHSMSFCKILCWIFFSPLWAQRLRFSCVTTSSHHERCNLMNVTFPSLGSDLKFKFWVWLATCWLWHLICEEISWQYFVSLVVNWPSHTQAHGSNKQEGILSHSPSVTHFLLTEEMSFQGNRRLCSQAIKIWYLWKKSSHFLSAQMEGLPCPEMTVWKEFVFILSLKKSFVFALLLNFRELDQLNLFFSTLVVPLIFQYDLILLLLLHFSLLPVHCFLFQIKKHLVQF